MIDRLCIKNEGAPDNAAGCGVERKTDSGRPGPVGVIIVAAGSASRMQGVDKQMLLLGKLPVLFHSAMAFQKCQQVREIVLVVRGEQVEQIDELSREYGCTKVTAVTAGGDSRQKSVALGLEKLSAGLSLIAVHDGARPFVTQEEIGRCILDARTYGAAALGVAARDTLKKADAGGSILHTVDRTGIYMIQTPQIFDAKLYHQAMFRAVEQGREYTDDCQLAESMGAAVHITPGSFLNLKITTPEDLAFAQAVADCSGILEK